MGMTMSQKILAAHAGLSEVKAGQLIEAKLDMVLGNDVTSPVAINVFEENGATSVFDNTKIAMIMDHFTPNKDIKAATQVKQVRTFADKYDIKNKLIAHKTKELFDHAAVALENSGITGLEDQLVFIIDDIINILVNNKPLLNFISKNLVMGALKSAFWSEEESDKIFYERYLELVEADTYNYKDIDIMLFTILELAGSTGYNSILFEEPVSIEAYKPFLYRTVRLIIRSHREEA